MNSTLIFRKAEAADTARILGIIAQAKAQMKALGSDQWQQGYPAAADIARDLQRGYGWVLCTPATPSAPEPGAAAGAVIAYGAAVFDGEPAYAHIDGAWLTEGDYVVVHRLAVAEEAKRRGVAAEFLRRTSTLAAERDIRAFRIDTNFDNRYMLRLLAAEGFTRCGEISYESGSRIAFEKRIGSR